MATVYTVDVLKSDDSTALARLTLIDDAGTDFDKWFSDLTGNPLGQGEGAWRQIASEKLIALMDPYGSKAFAALKYDTWPWKTGSRGDVTVAFPFKDTNGQLKYKYLVKRVS